MRPQLLLFTAIACVPGLAFGGNAPLDIANDMMEKDGVTLFDATDPSSGIGDVHVSAALRLGKATLRASVKAPTGDPDKLSGSGAADFAAHPSLRRYIH